MLRPTALLSFLAASLSIVFLAAGQAPQDAHEMHAMHNDPMAYIEALDDPARDAWQKPHEVMQALDIKPGELVADIGAGSGYFTLRLAHHVGDSGRVYGVDVSADMVLHLNGRIRDAGLRNVSTILASPDDPLLPQPVDRILVVDVWHHIEDRGSYLAKLKAALKPGGRIVMIDFQKRDLPVGPPTEMKIPREALIAEMEAGGFRLVEEHTFLPHQYFLVFSDATAPS